MVIAPTTKSTEPTTAPLTVTTAPTPVVKPAVQMSRLSAYGINPLHYVSEVHSILDSNAGQGAQDATSNAATFLSDITGKGLHTTFFDMINSPTAPPIPPQYVATVHQIAKAPTHDEAMRHLANHVNVFGGGILDWVSKGSKDLWTRITNTTSKITGRVADGIKAVVTGAVRLDFPPAARDWLAKVGDKPVFSMEVAKYPAFTGILNTAVNALTFGAMEREKKEKGYDTLYHLFLILRIANTEFELGKEQTVVFRPLPDGTRQKSNFQSMPVTGMSAQITANFLINGGISVMGKERFFTYDAQTNNCQNFIDAILTGAGANVNYPESMKSFVLQDMSGMWKQTHSMVPNIFRKVTDLAHSFDVAIHGQGFSPASLAGLHRYMLTDHPSVLRTMSGGSLQLMQHIFQHVPPISDGAVSDWKKIAHAPNASVMIDNVQRVNAKGGFVSNSGYRYPVSHILSGLLSHPANDTMHFVDYKGLTRDPTVHGLVNHVPMAVSMRYPRAPQVGKAVNGHRAIAELNKQLGGAISHVPSATEHSELLFTPDHMAMTRLQGGWLHAPPELLHHISLDDATKISSEARKHITGIKGTLLAKHYMHHPHVSVMTYDKQGNIFHIDKHGVSDARGRHYTPQQLPLRSVGGALWHTYKNYHSPGVQHVLHEALAGLTPGDSVVHPIASVISGGSGLGEDIMQGMMQHASDKLSGFIDSLAAPWTVKGGMMHLGSIISPLVHSVKNAIPAMKRVNQVLGGDFADFLHPFAVAGNWLVGGRMPRRLGFPPPTEPQGGGLLDGLASILGLGFEPPENPHDESGEGFWSGIGDGISHIFRGLYGGGLHKKRGRSEHGPRRKRLRAEDRVVASGTRRFVDPTAPFPTHIIGGGLLSGIGKIFGKVTGAVGNVLGKVTGAVGSVIKPIASLIPAPLLEVGLNAATSMVPGLKTGLDIVQGLTGHDLIGNLIGVPTNPPEAVPDAPPPAATDPSKVAVYSEDDVKQLAQHLQQQYQDQLNKALSAARNAPT